MKLNPYLFFDGDCAAAFSFYGEVFGQTPEIFRFSAAPNADALAPAIGNKVMHASLPVGDGVLMGSDTPTGDYRGISGVSVSVNVTDIAEAQRLFDALSRGGIVTMPLDRTFWAERFGMLTDRFGVAWMINCEAPSA
jgi:PhnB protein